jgi:DNA helicase-2/ATP-dependent DNA helicase PcrA
MKISADLHIHSHYSRATSPKLSPPWLDRWARIKGISLLGTGDCTHARWLEELREQLDDGEEGFYLLKKEVRRAFGSGPALEEGLPEPGEGTGGSLGDPRFVLTGEISTIYKKGDRTRKIHHLIILPGFRAAAAFNAKLERIGNIASDGRPILGIDSRDLLGLLLEADERSILIPAHIWTPWFSVLGAKSGFDSVEECYGDLSSFITAIETGLSSNPPMNWAVPGLDSYSIVSNSDAHSPDKLGREATLFEMDMSYTSLRAALAPDSGGERKITGTVEFFPQEGKYHYDGHRKCGVRLDPGEAAEAGGLCPVCGKALTRGVMSRVLELAGRPVDEAAACPPGSEGTNRRPYFSLIPLKELLGEILETGAGSKKVEAAYNSLIEKGGSEFSLLMDAEKGYLARLKVPGVSGELLVEAVTRMRSGEVSVSPGCDGEYGAVRVFAGAVPAESEGGLFGELPRTLPVRKEAVIKKSELKPGTGDSPAPAEDFSPAEKRSFTPDPAQAEAASYNGKQALIIAGPGTGKTAVLAASIVRLIGEGTDPASILAVSFTVKAAAELKERIRRFSGDVAVTVATFHSFCCSVLREQHGAAGLAEDFGILGEEEREALLREVCSSGESGKGRKKVRRLGDYIEERKRFLLLPGETSSCFGAAECPKPDPGLEGLYGEYRRRLRERGLLDFDDLVAGTVRLLASRKKILDFYRQKLRYVFVDEYQDINFAQYALIRLLAPPAEVSPETQAASITPSLRVIGDPNQAIYGFRGSDKRFIDRFLEDYPGARRFELTRSFRCAGPIIRAAGRLTGTSLQAADKLGGVGAKLYRTGYPTAASEAEGIARTIAALIGGTSFFAMDSGAVGSGSESGASPGDCAVLVRTAALTEPVAKAMKDHGIPFETAGRSVWWEEEPVKTLLDYLRKKRAVPEIPAKPPGAEIRDAWAALFRGDFSGPVKELLALAEIFGDLPSLLDGLSCSSAEGAPGIREEGVKIMTIHASKGLEFDHVFAAGLEEGIVPLTLYGREADIEEERRLLYVAMTRARRGLWLSWARARTLGGRKLSGNPSRFLVELEELVPPAPEGEALKRDPQLKFF